VQKHPVTETSVIATATAEENKLAESRAKDAAAREALAATTAAAEDSDEEVDIDSVEEDFDADESITE
jgi:small subunit ribosomal protein S6